MHTDRANKEHQRNVETDKLSEISTQLVKKEKEITGMREEIATQEKELNQKIKEKEKLQQKFDMGKKLKGFYMHKRTHSIVHTRTFALAN